MIMRIWHGWTLPENADSYEKLLQEVIFSEIRGLSIPGFLGIKLLRDDGGPETEFVTMMEFDSIESVKEFAGPDYELAVVPEAAGRLLSRFDHRSRHYTLQDA